MRYVAHVLSPLFFPLCPIIFFSRLRHPDDLVRPIHQNPGTGNTYVAKYFQQTSPAQPKSWAVTHVF